MEHVLLSQLDACKMKAPLLRQGACKMYAPSMHLIRAPTMYNMHAPPPRQNACIMHASPLRQSVQMMHTPCLLTFKLTLLSCLHLSQAVHLDMYICFMNV